MNNLWSEMPQKDDARLLCLPKSALTVRIRRRGGRSSYGLRVREREGDGMGGEERRGECRTVVSSTPLQLRDAT